MSGKYRPTEEEQKLHPQGVKSTVAAPEDGIDRERREAGGQNQRGGRVGERKRIFEGARRVGSIGENP